MSGFSNTFLVVEDNDDDVFALRWAFKKARVANPVQFTTDGRQALDYLQGRGPYADRDAYPIPRLIFLDLKLPYVSGFEVLEWIRTQTEFRALRVVILSGSDEARDHQRADALNATFYLVKPAMPADISRILEQIPDSAWDECDSLDLGPGPKPA